MKRRDFIRAGVAAVALAAVPKGVMATSTPRHATLEDLRRFDRSTAAGYDYALERLGKNGSGMVIISEVQPANHKNLIGEEVFSVVRTHMYEGGVRVTSISAGNPTPNYDKLLAFHNWRTS